MNGVERNFFPEFSTPLRKPRLGFLGVGWIGRQRMEAIGRSGCAEIVGVADESKSSGEAAGRQVQEFITQGHQHSPFVAHSLEDLLNMSLDGVIIATPSALHAEQSIAALRRGVAVFCQKPLARTAVETHRVVSVAKEHNRLLGVDLSYRFIDGARRIRELVKTGELGEIYASELTFHNAYGPDKAWFYDPKLSGGGCVIDLGVHLVDLAMWILNCKEATRVDSALYAKGQKVTSGNVVEDFASALVELKCGTSMQVACSWRLPAGCDARISAAFFGTKGGAILENVDGSFYTFRSWRCDGTKRDVLTKVDEDWSGRAAIAWSRRLAISNEFDPEIESVVNVADVLDRIYGRGEMV